MKEFLAIIGAIVTGYFLLWCVGQVGMWMYGI
jgi:hypothetical protein